MNDETIRVGLIGSGYMGKSFSLAVGAAETLFGLPVALVKEMVATSNETSASNAAAELGFVRWTADWRELVADPNVDVIINCTPNHLHRDIALAALAAQKPILSEKPLGRTKAEALDMVQAADKAGVANMAGYTYMKNPATRLAKEILDSGEIGRVFHFRGLHIEDYLSDPSLPITWRLQKAQAGSGAVGDLCHIINMAHYLCGEITEVVADSSIVIPERPDGTPTGTSTVDTDDQTHILCRFESGALGYLELSRVASGRKMGLGYEINGSDGTIVFDQARMSELKLFTTKDSPDRQGFRTILLGPEHSDYGYFNSGPGHGLGYNDMVAIEVRDFILGVVDGRPVWPNFADAYHTEEVLDAAIQSTETGKWTRVGS